MKADTKQNRFIPNSYQTPNVYIDELMPLLTPSEWCVLSYACRRIFGFQKRQDHISVRQFADGLTDTTGEQLDYGTGLSVGAVRNALVALKRYGILIEVKPNNPAVNYGALYRLQLDEDAIKFDELRQRKAENGDKNRDRTQRARVVYTEAMADPGFEPVESHDLAGGVLSDNTAKEAGGGVLSDNTGCVVGQHGGVLSDNTTINSRNTVREKQIHGATANAVRAGDQTSLFPESEQPEKPKGRSRKKATAQPDRDFEKTKQKELRAALIETYQKFFKNKTVVAGRDLTAATTLAKLGYTPEQLSTVYHRIKADAFWQGKHLSLAKVAEQMASILEVIEQEKEQTHGQATGSQPTTGHSGAGRKNDYGRRNLVAGTGYTEAEYAAEVERSHALANAYTAGHTIDWAALDGDM